MDLNSPITNYDGVSMALVHSPVKDREGREVVTNVTHFDIHDIARAAKTFGIANYFIVNRLRDQLMFVQRVIDHWLVGEGSKEGTNRQEALKIVRTCESLDALLEYWQGPKPLIVSTSARLIEGATPMSFKGLRERIEKGQRVLLLFGTGYGLTDSMVQSCDGLLPPILGPQEYNHLSVRSAVSICLDRILGK